MLKATNKKRLIGIILGLTASLFLVVHMALLMFSDLTREYHGFWIWIVVGVIAAIAGLLLLLGPDNEGEK